MYLRCLELQHFELEVLFREDEAYWVVNLDKAKIEMKEFEVGMKAILEKQ